MMSLIATSRRLKQLKMQEPKGIPKKNQKLKKQKNDK